MVGIRGDRSNVLADNLVDLSLKRLDRDLRRMAYDLRCTAALHGNSNRAIRTARILDDLRDRLGNMDDVAEANPLHLAR